MMKYVQKDVDREYLNRDLLVSTKGSFSKCISEL